MSIKLMQRAWGAKLGTNSKFVLLALAFDADENDTTTAAVSTLSQRCGLSRRAIFDARADLQRTGWVERIAVPGRGSLTIIKRGL